jgi:hypothetical protein
MYNSRAGKNHSISVLVISTKNDSRNRTSYLLSINHTMMGLTHWYFDSNAHPGKKNYSYPSCSTSPHWKIDESVNGLLSVYLGNCKREQRHFAIVSRVERQVILLDHEKNNTN